MKEENNLVNCTDSADKLVSTLLSDRYVSGAHIDFYDNI